MREIGELWKTLLSGRSKWDPRNGRNPNGQTPHVKPLEEKKGWEQQAPTPGSAGSLLKIESGVYWGGTVKGAS